jgi:hypothetical protein
MELLQEMSVTQLSITLAICMNPQSVRNSNRNYFGLILSEGPGSCETGTV